MIEEKENPSLILLHYFGGSAQSWRWVMKILREDFPCISLNIPGFGGSPSLEQPSIEKLAEDVTDQINRFGLTDYILVGHSMGAKIAMQMAANDHNKCIKHLILVAPSPPGIEPIEKKEKERMLYHPDLSEAKTTVEKISKIKLSPQKFDLAVENNLEAEKTVWNWWLEKGMNHSITASLKDLNVKITIINSENDPVITPKIIDEQLLNIFPKANLVTTETSGHLIPMENPQWLSEQIRKAITELK